MWRDVKGRPLSRQDVTAIAGLHDTPGFNLLLDVLQSEHDDILDSLAEDGAKTEHEERNLLGKWRAYRQLTTRLRNLSTMFAQDYQESLKVVSEEIQDGLMTSVPAGDFRNAFEALFSPVSDHSFDDDTIR